MSQQSYTDEIIERSRRDSRLSAESFGQDVYEMYCVPVRCTRDTRIKSFGYLSPTKNGWRRKTAVSC
jgi:hypothetical protein